MADEQNSTPSTEGADSGQPRDEAGRWTSAGNLDVDEAARMMSGLDDTGEGDGGDEGEADTGNAHAEGDDTGDGGEGDATAEGDGDGNEAETTVDDDPPDFWSAEERAAWAKVPTEAREVIRRKEAERAAFVGQKTREAVERAKAAEDAAKQAHDYVAQGAEWWAANRDRFVRTFVDKWAGVDWNKLADENPAEWARLSQQRNAEAGMLQEAEARGRADMEATQKRREAEQQLARREHHDKLAQKLPDYFGTQEKADATYKKLGQFLFEQGFPAERINQIYEAPVIEIALDAMRFREARAKAGALKKPAGSATNAVAPNAPKRIEPGPATRVAGNRSTDAVRQARERFQQTGDVGDAARLIQRLNI